MAFSMRWDCPKRSCGDRSSSSTGEMPSLAPTHILSIFRNEIQDYSILCVFLIVVIKFLIVCLSSFAKQRAKLLQTLLWSQLTKAVHCLAPGFFLMSICSSSSATSIIVFSARFFSFSRSSSACNSCSLASSASTVSFFSGFLVSSDIGI